ncbi:transmembrane protein [Paramyrothecium foliicola]|nr:transmembrane protein [Paramyrothecium foliicola]
MSQAESSSRSLSNFESTAIAQIVLFTTFLFIAIYLCTKHGFSLDFGWIYLLLLSVARLIGCSLRLALMVNPSNLPLTIGSQTLESVGLGMLILVLLGLVARIFDSINRHGQVLVKPAYQRTIDILMFVSMILSIVGGTETKRDGDTIEYSTASDASMGLMIAVVVFLCFEVYYLVQKLGLVAPGERRIFIAVVVSLPAVIVRLAYSCILTFGNRKETFGIYLGMSVIPEIGVVQLCEIVGLTLAKAMPIIKNANHHELQSQSSGKEVA